MIVLDCSAALELGRAKDPTSHLAKAVASADLIIAPVLFKYEVASAWRKYVRAGLCSQQAAATEVLDAVALVDVYASPDDYLVEAMTESVRLGHSPYDMFYFLLARRNAATLLTLDKAFGRLCLAEGVQSEGWQ